MNSQYEKRIIYTDYLEKTIKLICYQLLFTFASALFIVLCEPVCIFFQSFSFPIMIIGIIGSFIVIIYMDFADEMTINQLRIFTIFETLIINTFCSIYGHDIVIDSVFVTLGLSCCLCIYGFLTKYEFSHTKSILSAWLICFLSIGTCNLFFAISLLHTINLSLGIILFMWYLVYDVNYYLTMNMKDTITHDMHVRVAIRICLDILNLFVKILESLDMIKKNKNTN